MADRDSRPPWQNPDGTFDLARYRTLVDQPLPIFTEATAQTVLDVLREQNATMRQTIDG